MCSKIVVGGINHVYFPINLLTPFILITPVSKKKRNEECIGRRKIFPSFTEYITIRSHFTDNKASTTIGGFRPAPHLDRKVVSLGAFSTHGIPKQGEGHRLRLTRVAVFCFCEGFWTPRREDRVTTRIVLSPLL